MVQRYVSSCTTCARAKASHRGEIGALKPNEPPTERMQSVSMDLMSGMPTVTHHGQPLSQIVVLVDRLSKKIFIEPLSNTVTATDLATLLFQRIFSEHGFPEQIISDQDTLFTSNVWKALFALTGTRLTMSYSYHQRFDGQTEVMNRVIEEIMRCYLNYNQDNWVDLLPHITCAVNNAPNPKTGISANEIFYGRRPKMPVDLATRSKSCTNETAASIAQRIAYLNLRAQEASRLAISSYTDRHNASLHKLSDPRLRVGAHVMVTTNSFIAPDAKGRPSRKFTPKQVGPCEILQQLSDVSFVVRLPTSFKPRERALHARMLTYFNHHDQHAFATRPPPEPDHINDDGVEQWVVDDLTAFRMYYRKPQYFVTYRGYGVSDGQWIYRKHLLDDCPDLVTQADARFNYQPPQVHTPPAIR
jgi:hypothetical protein